MNYTEEHHLIARYAAQLSRYESGQRSAPSSPDNALNNYIDRQRQMIAQLEERNRELMREITKLRFNRDP